MFLDACPDRILVPGFRFDFLLAAGDRGDPDEQTKRDTASDFGSCECPFQTIGKRFFHNLYSGAAQERFGGFSAD